MVIHTQDTNWFRRFHYSGDSSFNSYFISGEEQFSNSKGLVAVSLVEEFTKWKITLVFST
jgi:hypothetical protein